MTGSDVARLKRWFVEDLRLGRNEKMLTSLGQTGGLNGENSQKAKFVAVKGRRWSQKMFSVFQKVKKKNASLESSRQQESQGWTKYNQTWIKIKVISDCQLLEATKMGLLNSWRSELM